MNRWDIYKLVGFIIALIIIIPAAMYACSAPDYSCTEYGSVTLCDE